MGSERASATMEEWRYEPATDLHETLTERLERFPREPQLWMYVARTIAALAIRLWLRLYHRFELRGARHLPLGRSFILVANHQSHLDALCLTAAIPLRHLHHAFPAAAADYFFRGLSRCLFVSVVVNGLPFDRTTHVRQSLEVCRGLLEAEGNILILFPEGTRSATGEVGRFGPGIAHLAVGVDVPVVPCHLEGADRAFPKGARWPRPRKLVLRIAPPRSYAHLTPGRRSTVRVCRELRSAVVALSPEER